MTRIDRDHYGVVRGRASEGARSNGLLGIKVAMQKAMYEPADVATYSGVSLTTVYKLISEVGYAYKSKDGQPKASAKKVAAAFVNKSVDDLFKPKSTKQQKPKCDPQSELGCE